MTTTAPLIGVTCCREESGDHPRHHVGEKYVACVPQAMGGIPVVVPSLGDAVDPAALVARLDGLLVTGSPSNVEPHHYEGEPSVPGTLHDPSRDATTLPLIRAAVAAGLPLMCICRGIQELNVALGGTLHQRVQELPGRIDHRSRKDVDFDAKYADAHAVTLTPGGALHELLGAARVNINSLHAQAIDRVAPGLRVEAVADDGTIEAVSLPGARGFVLAVQWHPEWPDPCRPVSRELFAAFARAARERARRRERAMA